MQNRQPKRRSMTPKPAKNQGAREFVKRKNAPQSASKGVRRRGGR